MINILKNEPLRKFLLWALTGIVICLVGITNVNAATYYMNSSFEQQYYDNRGSSVIAVTTSWNDSFNSYISSDIKTAAGSYGAGLSFSSPIPLLSNHTYSMSVYFVETNNITLSSKNIISVASSLSSAANDYANNNPGTTLLYSAVSDNKILQFVFKVDNNHTHIFFPWTTTTTTTQDYVLTEIIMEDLGSEGVSQEDINNSLTNQTNELNQSIQNSTNDINQNINDMEQSIIDSNKETQDVIKDQFNDCTLYNLTLTNDDGIELGILYSDGHISQSQDWSVSDYISIYGGYSYTLTKNYLGNVPSIVFYDKNKNYVKGISFSNLTEINFTLSDDIYYFRIALPTSDDEQAVIISSTEICSNKIDETNDKLDNLQGSITDDNTDGANDKISNFFDNFNTKDHGGLSSIITAPLTAINQMLNKNCSPMSATYKGKKIELPCGYEFWAKMPEIQNFLNIVLGGMLCYNILKKLYKLIERLKNPEDDRVDVMDL